MGLVRLLLAISVIIAHSTSIGNFNLLGGDLAVESFYVISGFYMSLILNEKYIGQNGSYKLFITNRLLRLYPLYYAVFALTIIFVCYTLYQTSGKDASFLQQLYDNWNKMGFFTILFLVFINLFILFQDWVMFMGFNTDTGNFFYTPSFRETNPRVHAFLVVPQAWTVGIEIAFYLIAPFLLRKGLKIIIPIILMSFAARFITYKLGYNYDPWGYRFFPFELAYFLVGNVCYKFYLYLKDKSLSNWIGNIALIGVLLVTLFYDKVNVPYKNFAYIGGFAVTLPLIFLRTKRWKRDTWIGDLSYPVYIVHFLMLGVIRFFELKGFWSEGLIATLLSVTSAIILNETIAKPIERYRQSRVQKTTVRFAIGK